MDKLLWTFRRRRALSAFLSVLLAVAMVLQGTAPGGIARAYADVAEQEEAAPQKALSSEAPECEEDPEEGEADGEGVVDEADPEAEATKAEATDAKEPEAANTQAESEVTEPTETATEPAAEPQPVKVTLRSDPGKRGDVVKSKTGEGEYGGLKYTWSMGWCTVDDTTNYSYDESGRLQVHPDKWRDNNTEVAMRFQLNVSPSSDQSASIPAGAVSFKVPLHLFKAWNGSGVDTLHVSSTLPRYPDISNSVDFSYTVDENEQIIISNYRELAGGVSFSTEFGWKVNALDVPGGHPRTKNADVSGNDWWKDYTGNFTNTFDASFSVTDVTGSGETQTEPVSFGLDMMTRVTGVTGAYPRPESDLIGGTPNNFYFSWQKAWGLPEPANADDYFYIAWVVDYGRTTNGKTTQPFKVDLDEFNPDENAIEIGGRTFKPEFVGSVKAADGLVGVSGNRNAYYANGWANIGVGDATGTPRTGRLALSKYNTLGYTAARTGYARKGNSIVSSTDTGGECDTRYTVLLRYPIEMLNAAKAAGINLEADGLKIKDTKFHFTETWDSTYQKHYDVVADPALVKVVNAPDGVGFIKTNGRYQSQTIGGAQTYLANGKPVDLRYTSSENGSYISSWYLTYGGTAKTRGDKILGQHITIEDDSIFMAPSNATNGTTWDMSPQEPLVEGDFLYRGFWVSKFDEYEGTYNSSLHVWSVNTEESEDYDKYEPIYIYTKTQGESGYTPYCAVKKDASRRGYTVYRCNGVGDDGKPTISDEQIPYAYGHFAFPANTVGVRAEHDSAKPFIKTNVQIDLGVRLLPTEHVKGIVGGHIAEGVDTRVCNEATCRVATTENPEEPYATMTQGNTPARNYFILNAIKVYQAASKSAYVLPDTDPRQMAAGLEDKQIAYVILEGRVSGTVANASADDDSQWEPYRPIEGTLYDLLPKGTTVRPGSVTGGYSHYPVSVTGWAAKEDSSTLPLDYNHGAKIIPEDCFSYTTELDPATGQYMLKIHYRIENPSTIGVPAGNNSDSDRVSFGFILENPTDNIITYGNITPNTTAFVLEGTYPESLRVNSRNTIDSMRNSLGDAANAYEGIASENRLTALGETDMSWNVLTTTQSGFSKTVRPLGTVESAPTVTYADKTTVTTGDGYEYRLRFVTSQENRADHVVLYDVLETGIDGEGSSESAWRGTFKGIDTSLIEARVTAGGTATCAPKVYYSTTVTEKNSISGGYFDLSDTIKWSETPPEDLSTVTAIAVDCSKDTEGKPFVLDKDQSLTALVTMDSPDAYKEGDAVNGSVVKYREFKNAAPEEYDASKDKLLSHSAKVTLTPTEPAIEKSSDPETGTSESPRVVDGLGAGKIDYTLKVTNSGTYDLNDVTVVDPIPEGLTFDVDDIKVKLNGAEEEKSVDELGGAITVAQSGRTLTFVISKQHPTAEKATTIIIPTKVVALTKPDEKRYENTARLTKANGINLGDDYVTDTMYHKTGVVEPRVRKVWNDGDNRDGIRPTSVTVNLYNDGTDPIDTCKLSEANGWSHTFGLLPKFAANGTEIAYTVDEVKVKSYATQVTGSAASGYTVTNKLDTVDVVLVKTWDDLSDAMGDRPGTDAFLRLVTLKQNGTAFTKVTPTVAASGNTYTVTWKGLPKSDANGEAYAYSVEESVVANYNGGKPGKVEKGPDAYHFVAENTRDTGDLTVEKKVTSPFDSDHSAKFSFTVELSNKKINGTFGDMAFTNGKAEFELADGESATATGLPKGVGYTVTEAPATGFKTTKAGDEGTIGGTASKATFTNALETEDVSGTKTWNDKEYQGIEGYSHPTSVTVKAIGEVETDGGKQTVYETDEKTVGEADGWNYGWTGLPSYKDGKKITYRVVETSVPSGFGATYNGASVINTPVDKKEKIDPVSLEIVKTDAETGHALAGAIFEAKLKGGDAVVASATTGADGKATLTFEAEGTYVLTETAPTGYTSDPGTWEIVVKRSGVDKVSYNDPNAGLWTWFYHLFFGEGTTYEQGTLRVSNPPVYTDVEVHKKWVDDGDRDGLRPGSIRLQLYKQVGEGDPVAVGDVITVTGKGDDWSAQVKHLPTYEDGLPVTYTLDEVGVPKGYKKAVDGMTVTNTHTPELVDVPVKKVWDDNNDQDGCRPGSVDVTLSGKDAGGTDAVLPEGTVATQTLAEGNGWAYTWTDLYKYQNHGKEITYTVTEAETETITGEDAPHTYSHEVTGGAADGITVTNKHTPEKVEVKVSKDWDDADDQDGCRPESVEVELLADGEPTGDRLTLDEGNGWAGAFTGLNKYKAGEVGKLVGYTVREVETETVTGEDAPRTYAWEVAPATDEAGEVVEYAFAITNTHTPETVDVPVSKAWDDGDDANGVRPDSIVVRLLADGGEVDSATIEPDADGNWAHAFTGLPKYRDHGTEIAYTVEEDPVPGYEAAYDGTDITNTHEVEAVTVNPPIKKTVEGDGAPADAKFTFTFRAEPGRSELPEGMSEMPMPKGSDGQVKTVTVKGPGEYEFGEFGIERPGTYVYTMSEEDAGGEGWTYDGATYTVTYVVEARDGHLSATTKIERDGKAYSSDTPEFVNSYEGKRHHKRRLAQTGDPTPTYLPWLMVAGSALLACGLVLSRRRRRG